MIEIDSGTIGTIATDMKEAVTAMAILRAMTSILTTETS